MIPPSGFPSGASGKEPICQSRRCKRCGFRSLVQEDPLKEGMATHSSILAWETPGTEVPGGLQFIGSQRAGHDWSDLARTHALPESSPSSQGFNLKRWRVLSNETASQFFGLPLYFKFKILFYTFTKTLGQRFDIFSSPSARFISINHCCSSNRVHVSVILSESALSSIIYLF